MTLQNSGTEGTQIDAYTLKWTVVIELGGGGGVARGGGLLKFGTAQKNKDRSPVAGG